MNQLSRKRSFVPAFQLLTRTRWLTAVVFASCIAACSWNTGESPVVRGILPSDLRAASYPGDLEAQSIGAAVTRVGAIRVVAGNMNVETIVSVPVQPDGSFEVPYPTQNAGNQLLITMNEDASTPLERSQGVIALANDSGINLAGLPLDNTFEDVDLGQLDFDPATRESLSSLSTLQQSELFNLSPNELLDTIFRTNSARGFVSRYSNHRENGVGQFDFEQGVTGGDPDTGLFTGVSVDQDGGVNNWTDHLLWLEQTTLRTLVFRMPIPDSDIDFEAVSSGELTLILTPPYEIEANSNDLFGPDTPVRYSGSGDWSVAQGFGANFNVWEQDDGGGGLYLLFETFDDILPGVWTLEIENGRQLAIADTGSDVTTTADGTYLYYLPALRLEVDETTGRIEQIHLRMFRYSAGAGTYVEVTPGVWQEDMSWRGLQLIYNSDAGGGDADWLFDVGAVITPDINYYMPSGHGFPDPPDGSVELATLIFAYDLHDIRFSHRFNN